MSRGMEMVGHVNDTHRLRALNEFASRDELAPPPPNGKH